MPLGTFLDGDNPSQLRGLAWLSLSELGWKLTKTVTSDSGGGGTAMFTPGGTVSCRIDPFGQGGRNESTFGGRLDERSTHVVTLPAGTDVGQDDRFVISGRGTFEVTAVRERTREWAAFIEVVAT
jgi:hypothetical protein